MERSGRIGIVPPRYGPEILGGAEAAMRQVALGLAGRGWDVEVLTTCAHDHFTWANEYPAGESVDTHDGSKVGVRRFPAVVDTPRAERRAISAELNLGSRVDIRRQQRWINDDMRSPELWHHLLHHAGEYRALVFAPYHAWTTFAGSQVAPGRTIVWPKLHDEPEAYLDVFEPVFRGARGIWFQSEPERDLTLSIYPGLPRHRVVGAGLTIPDSYDPDGFRRRHGIDGRFVLYAGRREGGKGWDWLLRAFLRAVHKFDLPLRLVTIGGGQVHDRPGIEDRVIDLGFLTAAERDNAFAAADAYLQPSSLEALSLTVLEAFLAGTPVIANAASEVVAWHCRRSGAGLTFSSDAEFAHCLRLVAEQPEHVAGLGQPGRDYVLAHYRPSDALDRIESTLDEWMQ